MSVLSMARGTTVRLSVCVGCRRWYCRSLGLGTNQLSGTLPPSMSNLASLTYMDIRGNFLPGTVPSTIALLTNLRCVACSRWPRMWVFLQPAWVRVESDHAG